MHIIMIESSEKHVAVLSKKFYVKGHSKDTMKNNYHDTKSWDMTSI